MRLLTDAEAVVEHDPGAAERPGERGALARRRVEAVVVPELHVTSIFGLMARYGDIRTGRHRVFDSVFVTRYRHPVFTAAHLERMEQIMRDVCRDFECELAEFNGEANHVLCW
jgi:Transposase IS200 like